MQQQLPAGDPVVPVPDKDSCFTNCCNVGDINVHDVSSGSVWVSGRCTGMDTCKALIIVLSNASNYCTLFCLQESLQYAFVTIAVKLWERIYSLSYSVIEWTLLSSGCGIDKSHHLIVNLFVDLFVWSLLVYMIVVKSW